MIHTTIGLYPSGDYKVNGVTSDNLQSHIEYNKKYRPGRALIVDGNIVYNGMMQDGHILKVMEVKKLKDITATKNTQPYV